MIGARTSPTGHAEASQRVERDNNEADPCRLEGEQNHDACPSEATQPGSEAEHVHSSPSSRGRPQRAFSRPSLISKEAQRNASCFTRAALWTISKSDLSEIRQKVNAKESALVIVEDDTIRVEDNDTAQSSLCTITGTTVAYLFMCILGSMIANRFYAYEPAINEITMEGVQPIHEMPDIALTYNLESTDITFYNILETSDILEYIWPVFYWETRLDAFNRVPGYKSSEAIQDGVRLGAEACGLESVSGNTWPVFCLMGSDQKLRGRCE